MDGLKSYLYSQWWFLSVYNCNVFYLPCPQGNDGHQNKHLSCFWNFHCILGAPQSLMLLSRIWGNTLCSIITIYLQSYGWVAPLTFMRIKYMPTYWWFVVNVIQLSSLCGWYLFCRLQWYSSQPETPMCNGSICTCTHI